MSVVALVAASLLSSESRGCWSECLCSAAVSAGRITVWSAPHDPSQWLVTKLVSHWVPEEDVL